MKKTLIAPALLLVCALAQAQQSASPPSATKAAQPANTTKSANTVKSVSAARPAASKTVVAKAAPASRHAARPQTRKTAAQAVVEDVPEVAATPEELAIAEHVYVGHINCERGAAVDIGADARDPGRFDVAGKGFKYHMTPVVTTTGAVRLEDKRAGAVWIQVASKSMLMNQKLGQRVADDCMSPEQGTVAQAIKDNPPPSLLEAPKPGQ
jgi:hypothetical protein